MKKRVLVVDDNKDAANTLAAVIRLMGHDVQVAFDGIGAVHIARTSRPEVIFLDIGMPGMDGYEVAELLRDDPKLAGVVLAAVTGYGEKERCRQAGFHHHFLKPADIDRVQDLLSA